MSKNRSNKSWKRWLIILICLGLLTVHLTGPRIQFDATSIWLIAIAAFFLVIPDPSIFFPYIKRIKLWEAEIELKEEVKELGKEVDKVQETVANMTDLEVPNSLPPEVDEVLNEAGKDPRAALLLLSSKLETALRDRLEEANLLKGGRVPNYESLRLEARSGAFPEGVISAYQDFRKIRNKIAHDYTFQVDNNTIYALISLGTELLKVLSKEQVSKYHNNINSGVSDVRV
jgi:hypothetical protein